MTNLWIDANVLLRLLTNDPPEMAQKAVKLAQKAEQGEINLKLLPIVVAEVIWVLNSFYKYSRSEITEVLIPLITAEGIEVENQLQVIAALEVMTAQNVDFLDAYLAEVARSKGEAVVSFDRDFRKLDVLWLEPD
jgi:predicted nucleic acid-binding protein